MMTGVLRRSPKPKRRRKSIAVGSLYVDHHHHRSSSKRMSQYGPIRRVSVASMSVKENHFATWKEPAGGYATAGQKKVME